MYSNKDDHSDRNVYFFGVVTLFVLCADYISYKYNVVSDSLLIQPL